MIVMFYGVDEYEMHALIIDDDDDDDGCRGRVAEA